MPSIKNVHILVLLLDDAAQSVVQTLRQQYYPTYTSKMPAHLTLIHTLPIDIDIFDKTLQAIAAAQPIFAVNIDKILPFKNGNALGITSKELMQLHQDIVTGLLPLLYTKDRQFFEPHITIQYKVTSWKAQQIGVLLQQTWQPYLATAMGMQLLTYELGVVKTVKTYFFKANTN